jgi:hypothetical protein
MWLFHLSDEQRSRSPARALPFGFRRIGAEYFVARLGKDLGHSLRRAPRLRPDASETRLMGNYEIGSC